MDHERILLVEHDKETGDILRYFLQDFGYAVTLASNSLDARHAFRNSPFEFDLGIVDEDMPLVSGAQLAREFVWACPKLPVILYVNRIDHSAFSKAGELGVGIIGKSRDPWTLINAVNRRLRQAGEMNVVVRQSDYQGVETTG